jgi:UDP-N-acetylmuramate dehydrogenase
VFVRNFPLSEATSLGVGGCADYFARPTTEEELISALRFAEERNLDVVVLGYGTNVLVRSGGIRGLVIQMADNFAHHRVDGTTITASAGCMFSAVSKLAAHHSLTGLEFAVGIPGGIGGAVFMNAGAYDGEIGPLIRQVNFVTAAGPGSWHADEFTYSYRHSRVQQERIIVTSVVLGLRPGNKDDILGKMHELQAKRQARQPLEFPSAGSTFKRPAGHYVGPMIEEAGLKGYRIGGAEVSTKHAGFIINRGGATADDFLHLIQYIQREIKQRFNVDLEPEIRILGSL